MKSLFQPVAIGSMVVKNRFVRSATQDWLGNEDGGISDNEVALYQNLAINDVGLIISAHTYVSAPLGRASIKQNALFDDRFINGYSRLCSAVHQYGAKLVVQISHAGRQTTPDLIHDHRPKAPSPVTDTGTGVTPEEFTGEEIYQLIDDFVNAMERVKRSGADGVQLHIAHGYCLSQFLSPYTNRRSDMWGGNVENRARILSEIMTRGRKAVGGHYPILAKLNSTDGFDGPEYLSITDVIFTAKLLESLGLDGLEISGGIREAKGVMSRPGIQNPEQEAYFLPAARELKKHLSIPVILVGGLRSLSVIESILSESAADLFAFSRPFIKEPSLVVSLQNGQDKVSCVSCNACFNPQGLQCYYRGGNS